MYRMKSIVAFYSVHCFCSCPVRLMAFFFENLLLARIDNAVCKGSIRDGLLISRKSSLDQPVLKIFVVERLFPLCCFYHLLRRLNTLNKSYVLWVEPFLETSRVTTRKSLRKVLRVIRTQPFYMVEVQPIAYLPQRVCHTHGWVTTWRHTMMSLKYIIKASLLSSSDL